MSDIEEYSDLVGFRYEQVCVCARTGTESKLTETFS